VRQKGGIEPVDERFVAELTIAGQRKSACAEPMVSIREGDDIAPIFDFAGQFEGSLDGVGASRAGELDFVRKIARREDETLESLEELTLGNRPHVQSVHDTIALQVFED